MEQAPNTESLDEYLKDVVNALHKTVNWGMPHVKDPLIADRAIHDCEEILDVIMKGEVSEWLS